ncbi:MAG: hypothetical protein VKL42_08710, partial [Snowella sp.]|nr:hypothetical protein [Snowella sp.]
RQNNLVYSSGGGQQDRPMNSLHLSARLPRPLYDQLESRALSRRSSLSLVVMAALMGNFV